MCEPVSISASTAALVSTGVSAASAVTSFVGQSVAADAQAEAQQERVNQQAEIARESFIQDAFLENQRLAQQREQAAQESQKTSEQALEKKSQARVSAGESGVSGLNVDALVRDFERQEAEFRSSMQQNVDARAAQAERRKDALRTKAQGRIANIPTQPISSPSPLGAALKIGGAAASQFTEVENDGDLTVG